MFGLLGDSKIACQENILCSLFSVSYACTLLSCISMGQAEILQIQIKEKGSAERQTLNVKAKW